MCAIVLFVRRWGKIRMLVPAQPAYVYEEAAAKADADKGANAAKVRKVVAQFGVKSCGFDSC